MIQPILQFRNADSTLDLNNQLAGFFSRGIITGGLIVPVPNSLSVQIPPWKLIGSDGMVVMDQTDTVTLPVLQNQTNVIVFLSQYSPTSAPALGFQVMELSAYQSAPNIEFLTVFGFVTLGPLDTQVQLSAIDYSSRDEIDPVSRTALRGVLANDGLLPSGSNRGGDFYCVTSGAGDNPAIYMWNGVNWLNITDTLTVASLLSAHRNNLFPNEIHLTDEQAAAALGTFGTPGVSSISSVTIDIPSGIVSLPAVPVPAITSGSSIRFTTTGSLPMGLALDTSYYAIAVSPNTLRIANSYQNALLGNPITMSGTQSGIQTMFFTGNAYVTSTDPRLPIQGEADALIGLPSTPPPSASNPFVTGAYPFAVPSSLTFSSNPGAAITISAIQGPVYLGKGGAGTQLEWFNFFNATLEREYVNTDGSGVSVQHIYTDPSLLPQFEITNPSTTLSIDADGFYSGNLYLVLNNSPDQPGRLIYGQRQTFSNLFKGFLMQLAPTDSQTNQEVLRKFLTLSGRSFDTVTPAEETNVALRESIVGIRNYLNAVTAADLVVDEIEWARLRQIPETALDFPLDTGEVVVLAGSQTFTVGTTSAAIESFDPTITSPDVGAVAIITYTSSVALANAKPGYTFIDGAGTRFRVLAVNSTQSSLMIYTGGATVVTTIGVTTGQVLQGNNPFQTEQDDLAVSLFRETVPVQGINPAFDMFEILPPGGNAIGVGASAFTAIGTNLLPNQGNAAGAPAGRPIYQITPVKQGNRYDRRFYLLGDWANDSTSRRVIGNVSQGALGIDFTGRIQDLTLYTSFTPNTPYVFQVFIDGVYSVSASQQLSQANLSEALFTLRDPEVLMQPVVLSLGLSLTQIHNVRIEITSVATDPFYLYAVGVVTGNNFTQEKGVAYLQTDIQQITSISSATQVLVPAVPQPSHELVYLDRTTQLIQTVAQQNTHYYRNQSGFKILAGSSTLSLGANFSQAALGDVLELSDGTQGSVGPDSSTQNTQYRRIVALNPIAATATLDAAVVTTATRYEYAYSVPVRVSDGAVVLSAPQNPLDVEYARLGISDFDVGVSRDISNLSNSAPENRVTVLDDGSTSLLLFGCQQALLNITGFPNGIQLTNPNSFLTFQAHCTRIDLVFCGNQGPATAKILVDGLYTYTVQLSGSGLERHSVFYSASPQTHCIQVSPATAGDAGKVVVGQFILHDLVAPAVNGLVLAEYTKMRTGQAPDGAGNISDQVVDYASLDQTNPLVTSYAGIRIFDPTKVQTRLYDGPATGSFGWTVFEDFSLNPRFGYYLQAANANSQIDIEFYGQGIELYIQQSPSGGSANVLLNGIPFNFTNYPNTVPHGRTLGNTNPTSPSLTFSATGNTVLSYLASSAQLVRIPIPFASNPGSFSRNVISLISNTGAFVNVFAIGEYAGAGQAMRRNLDDTSAGRVHFSSFKDLRKFTTLLPDQIGIVAGESDAGGGTSGLATIPLATSGLIDIADTSYQFGVYNDWSMDSDPLDSALGPSDISTGYTNATLFDSAAKAAVLNFDCSESYTLVNEVVGSETISFVTLSGPVSWAIQTSDLVGAVFQPLGTTNAGALSRITAATALNQFQIEDLLTPTSGDLCGIKQCLYTKELVQFKPGTPGDDQSVADRVPLDGSGNLVTGLVGLVSQDIVSILFDAEASLNVTGTNALDPLYGQSVGGLVAFTANSQGLRTAGQTHASAVAGAWTSPTVLPEYSEARLVVKYPPADTNPQRLFLRIFPGPTTGTGTVNLLRWACLFMEDPQSSTLGIGSAFAYGYTDNSTPATNCTITVNSAGKTQINLVAPYDYGAFAGSTDSVLNVTVDGKVFAKEIANMSPTDGYFNEVNSFTLTLDSNYSAVSLPIRIQYKTAEAQYIRIGTFNPLTWTLGGTVAVTGEAFDGPRSTYEAKSFTRFKLAALNTGSSGTTTVQLFRNGVLASTANMPAGGGLGFAFTAINITAAIDDLYTVLVTGAAVGCRNLTVELS